MGARSFGAGFTIVEVMVVLAVTGGLFLAAAIMISGRQNQTAFDQAIQNVQSQIQAAIDGVAVGFYPEKGSFSCSAGGGGAPPNLTIASSGQGTNSGCIFLGQALQFQLAGSDPEEFVGYTIAGLQQGCASTSEATCLDQAEPATVAPGSTHPAPNYPDNSVAEELQNGLTTVRMWYNNGAGDVEIGAVAFTYSLADLNAGDFGSGGPTSVNAVAVAGTALGSTSEATVEAMNGDGGNGIATGVINPSGGIFICFDSGGTNDWGIIQIGGGGRELSVNLRIKDKTGGTCDNT